MLNIQKLSGTGPIQNTVNKLIDAVQSIYPQSGPGVLTDVTTRGVTRKATLATGQSNAVEELVFLREFDDYLQCSNARTGSTEVYVYKPRSLRSHTWSTGFDYVSEPTHNPKNFVRALIRANTYSRWRLKFSMPTYWAFIGAGKIQQLRSNDADDADLTINYTYVREQIYPPYTVQGSDTRGNNTNDICYVYALPLQSYSVGATAGETADDATVAPTGTPINFIDANNDSRSWQPVTVTNRMDLGIKGTSGGVYYARFVGAEDTQRNDQTFGNTAPKFSLYGFLTAADIA